MSATSENDKRIAKNTVLLYVRMLFIMLVSFYITRITLEVLGAGDYGIYGVVGGLVTMFSMFTTSLTSAANRFLAVELGRGNRMRLNVIFSSAVNIQILMAVIVIVLAESIGAWFLNHKMNIPASRMYAANWVFHCSILMFAANLLTIPYNAVIITHERMKAFAGISILDIVLKLAAACFLLARLYDGLIVYSILLFLEAVTICAVYGSYCKRHFEECRYRYVCDRGLLKDMASFAGWNFIGVTSGVLRDHGVNILLNLFFNPAVNAARTISVQVGTAINSFVSNFMTALNPQIMKSYATGDKNYMMSLVYRGTRFSYYLLLFFSLPLLLETDTVLHIWLKSFPEHTLCFCQLMIVFILSESISQPLVTSMFSIGKIRNYQIVVGGTQMLIVPLSYLALQAGAPPEMAFYITIFISQICLFLRLLMLHSMIDLRIVDYMRKVYLNILYTSVAASILPVAVSHFLPNFFLITGLCMINTVLAVYNVGCSKEERCMIKCKTGNLICKFLRK